MLLAVRLCISKITIVQNYDMPSHLIVTTTGTTEGDQQFVRFVQSAVQSKLDSLAEEVQVRVNAEPLYENYCTIIVRVEIESRSHILRRRIRTHRDPRGDAGGGILGVVIMAAASQGISAKLSECARETVASILILIDRAAGQKPSPLLTRWYRWMWAKWLIPIAWISVALPLTLQFGNPNTTDGALLVYLWQGFLMFGMLHFLALIRMPVEFYRDVPQGQRLLARTGIPDVIVLRYFLSVCLAIALALWVWSTTMFPIFFS